MVVGFVHIDLMGDHFIGSALSECTLDSWEVGRGKLQVMMDDVLVEGKQLFLGGGIVGSEETEGEVMLVDGDAQN